MMQPLSQTILDYLEAHRERYLSGLRELAQIPAPSGQEQQRAAWCKQRLEALGAKGVYIDSACNVIFPYYAEGCDDLTVFNAHLDVVFPDTTPLPIREENGRLCGPGVGDDTANVLAVIELAALCLELGLRPKKGTGILFVLNSCEEGLGNLKGARQLMADYAGRIRRMVAVDGGVDEFVNDAVGSKRFEVTVRTEGGHSYGSFGNRNAIRYLAQMIDTLYTMKVPDIGKTTYNVGTIQGGTSVNTIAQECHMLFEYRSDKREGLEAMDRLFWAVIEAYRAMGIQVEVETVGDRPCAAEVDVEPLSRLVMGAGAAQGLTMTAEAGSTDCNIPLSQGIPAVCFGVYRGHGAHTREEWIDLESTRLGLRLLTQFFLEWVE